jgi:MFS family permease
MQVKNIFLLFPIVVILGAGGALLSPSLWIIVGSMLSVKLIRETLDDSGRKSIQSLVPEERRGRVSTFIDNYLPASGTIIACLVTGAIVLIGIATKTDLHIAYLSVAFLCGALAFWAVLKMRKVYESSLLNWRLKRRQRVSDTLIGKIANL